MLKTHVDYKGHVDNNGIKYKLSYDKTQTQGDEDFGKADMIKLFEALTDK